MSRADVLHFTPTDYLSDYKTRRLDLEEHGAYMLLLWHMWNDSDCQCEFPMDSLALASIWGVSPERAMQVCESLIAPGVSLVKVVERASGTVLQSKRLREQVKAFSAMLQKKSEAGVRSGAVRRANKANTCSTPVEHLLNKSELTVFPSLGSPDVSKPEDITPVSSSFPEPQRKGRGSYPQAEDPAITIETYIGKLGRDLTGDETASCKRWVRDHGAFETQVQLGYAARDGYIDNPKRIGGALKAASKRSEGATA